MRKINITSTGTPGRPGTTIMAVNMASLQVAELVAVCERCFDFEEDSASTRRLSLIEKKCLQPSAHKDAIKVRVYLDDDGVLKPEVRPMPSFYFKGKYRLCSESGKPCRGFDKCSFAHCLKEKAAWNAEKLQC